MVRGGRFFVHKFLCTGWDAVGLRPMRRVSVKSPPSSGDLSAGGACPSPYAHAGGLRTPSAPEPDHQTTGATRAEGRGRRTRRGKRSAHGQRPGGRPQRQRGCKGARPARNRPRRRRGARERAPRPPLKFPLGGEPRRGKPDGGKGGAPLDGRGGGRGASPREMISPALPHATASAAAIGQASARRQAAGAPKGRKGHAPARRADARESAASGQADQTDDGEAASGRGSNCPPPRASETARPRQRTAKRRRGGRRRRRPGGTRTQEQAAYSLPSAQSAPLSRRSSAADADGSDEHGAQNGGTAAGRGEPKGAPQTPLPRAQRGARPSGRATGQATGRKADGRDGAAGAILAACAPLWRFFPLVVGSGAYFVEKTLERAKKRKKGA